jgi:solute carrier family 25 phosphate transporter 3
MGKEIGPRRKQSTAAASWWRAFLTALFICIPVASAFSSPNSHSVLFSPQSTNVAKLRTSASFRRPILPSESINTRNLPSDATLRFLTKKSHEPHRLFPDFFPAVGISTADKALLVSMSLATAFAFAALMSVSGPGAWRYFLAGGICAAVSHAITTPIDVVKTRKQVDSTLRNCTFVEATSKIIKEEGLHSLSAGLGPTIVGYLFEGSLKFGIYEILKPAIGRFLATFAQATNLAFVQSKAINFILCGTASGVAASAMLCPMEAIRIRQVAEPYFAPGGWVQAGLKMLKNEGFTGLWKGMTPMLYKQVPYTVTKNVSFDFLTNFSYMALRNAGYAMNHVQAVLVPLLSAFMASILSCISSQPGDMLLSLVNAHEGDMNANDFLKQISRSKRGLRGLFVGTNERFLHVGMIVTIQLMIYDAVKRFVGIAATGTV